MRRAASLVNVLINLIAVDQMDPYDSDNSDGDPEFPSQSTIPETPTIRSRDHLKPIIQNCMKLAGSGHNINLVCRLNLEASRKLASPIVHQHVLYASHQTTFPEAATHEKVRTRSRCPSPHCCPQLAPSRWPSALSESQATVLYLLCQIHMYLRFVCECTRLGHRCCTEKHHQGEARCFQ